MNNYYQTLPAKRMGSGCLIFNSENEILLVKPTYKTGWEIPGGAVEDNESPRKCCEREVQEELGLTILMIKLLVVDYNTYPTHPEKTEALMFIFDGGVIDTDTSSIALEPELDSCSFYSVKNLPTDIDESLAQRIQKAVEAKKLNTIFYLEDQK